MLLSHALTYGEQVGLHNFVCAGVYSVCQGDRLGEKDNNYILWVIIICLLVGWLAGFLLVLNSPSSFFLLHMKSMKGQWTFTRFRVRAYNGVILSLRHLRHCVPVWGFTVKYTAIILEEFHLISVAVGEQLVRHVCFCRNTVDTES